jgi:hypothetical protein
MAHRPESCPAEPGGIPQIFPVFYGSTAVFSAENHSRLPLQKLNRMLYTPVNHYP